MRILFNPTINPIKTSFTQRKKAVYVFNKDYEYRKYNSQQEASESLGIPISGISACAANRINSTYGYIVFNAEDIEKRDENNNIIIDVNDKQDRFNSAYKNKGNSVKKVKNGIYAVDKDGNFTKFKTKKEAAQALGLSIDVVKRCMKHNSIANGSYLLLYAEDVEKQDENGENTADLCKIKKLTKKFEYHNGKNPIYAIDENGQYQKYESLLDAAEKLSISHSDVSRSLNDKIRVRNGFVFLRAEDVEKFDENGDTVVDTEKLNKLAELKRNKIGNENKSLCVYRITKEGKFKRYGSINEASRQTGITGVTIKAHLLNKTATKDNQAFISASDVDIYTPDGTIKPNKQVLRKFYKDIFGEKE